MIWQTDGVSKPDIRIQSPIERIHLVIYEWQYRRGNDFTLTRKSDNSQFWIEFHSYEEGKSEMHVKLEISEESFIRWYLVTGLADFKPQTFQSTIGLAESTRAQFLSLYSIDTLKSEE